MRVISRRNKSTSPQLAGIFTMGIATFKNSLSFMRRLFRINSGRSGIIVVKWMISPTELCRSGILEWHTRWNMVFNFMGQADEYPRQQGRNFLNWQLTNDNGQFWIKEYVEIAKQIRLSENSFANATRGRSLSLSKCYKSERIFIYYRVADARTMNPFPLCIGTSCCKRGGSDQILLWRLFPHNPGRDGVIVVK